MTTLLLLLSMTSFDVCVIPLQDWPTLTILEIIPCNDNAPSGDCLTAEAGEPQESPPNVTITLDGSGTSTPHSPEDIQYTWSQVDNGAPKVTLSGADTAMPTFSADTPGVYEFSMTVSWYCREESDTVMVEVLNDLPPTELNAELVSSPGCTPMQVTNAGDARLFVVCQTGEILIIDNGSVLPTPFLDIDPLVTSGGERGLLSVAFHPDYASNGFFYVNYTGTDLTGSGALGSTRIAGFGTDAGNPNLADPNNSNLLMSIEQPFSNHNGGQIKFGQDGHLYIGTGDGGSGGDPLNAGQRMDTLLGKMLRIQINGLGAYSIPANNPFAGDPDILDEIWANGLRNPWRFSFDRMTGDMYIGDVGQGSWEEISFQDSTSTGGENYGWRLKEGNNCFNPSSGCDPGGLTDPIFEYPHGVGSICSVTGGYVYRGADIPNLQGFYIFADYCGSGSGSGSAKRFWSLVFRDNNWIATDLNVFVDDSVLAENVVSFGEDHEGELYICTQQGNIYKITGIRSF